MTGVDRSERTDPKTKAKSVEYSVSRDSVQWACWLYGLEDPDDRLLARDLIALAGKACRDGQDFAVVQALERRRRKDRAERGLPPDPDDDEADELAELEEYI